MVDVWILLTRLCMCIENGPVSVLCTHTYSHSYPTIHPSIHLSIYINKDKNICIDFHKFFSFCRFDWISFSYVCHNISELSFDRSSNKAENVVHTKNNNRFSYLDKKNKNKNRHIFTIVVVQISNQFKIWWFGFSVKIVSK